MKNLKLYKDWDIKYFKIVSSTMEEIKKKKYSYKNTAIISEEQTRGRGRGNKIWISEKGNFYASLKTKMAFDNKNFLLSYILGIIIYDVIKLYLPKNKNILIKWPNDILVNKKKIAGILIESCSFGNKLDEVIVGIGININSYPKISGYETTCINKEGNTNCNINILLTQIIDFFESWRTNFENTKADISLIIKQWMKRSFVLNEKIRIKLNNKFETGLYRGIAKDGSIKLLVKNKIKNYTNFENLSF